MMKTLYILTLFIAFSFAQPVQVLAIETGFDIEVLAEDVFDFNLSVEDNEVDVAWDKMPKNTKSFMIERSFDGKRYSRIYQSSMVDETNFADDLSYVRADDVIYYRFTITLTNGKEVTSSSKFVSLTAQNHLKAQVTANGGQVDFDFYSSSNGYTTVQIFNGVGNAVAEDRIRSVKGDNSHIVTLYGMRSGMYFLRLEQDGKSSTTKFFVR